MADAFSTVVLKIDQRLFLTARLFIYRPSQSRVVRLNHGKKLLEILESEWVAKDGQLLNMPQR